MGYGVFIHRADSVYKDSPAEQYQFPTMYLRRVQSCVGDWIVYYEPRKVSGTKGYFAIAKVQQVVSDPSAPGMYIAIIEPGSYLDFANPVPFNLAGGPVERGVLNDEGRLSGRAQSAVRPISPADFNRILEIGLEQGASVLPRTDDDGSASEIDEEHTPFVYKHERERLGYLGSRIVRDRIFRQVVLRAYDERCAMTGLKLINGLGRAEVAAAHIRPVTENGPDTVTNGLALSGTAHWMFDRGLIGLSNDLEILISRQVNDLEGVRSFVNKSGRALVPARPSERPHPHFLDWHRVYRFKH